MKRLVALGLMSLPLACPAAGDYLGILRVPQSSLNPTGLYSFSSGPSSPTTLAPDGYRLKLGYKATRYFSVEGEFSSNQLTQASECGHRSRLRHHSRGIPYVHTEYTLFPMLAPGPS